MKNFPVLAKPDNGMGGIHWGLNTDTSAKQTQHRRQFEKILGGREVSHFPSVDI